MQQSGCVMRTCTVWLVNLLLVILCVTSFCCEVDAISLLRSSIAGAGSSTSGDSSSSSSGNVGGSSRGGSSGAGGGAAGSLNLTLVNNLLQEAVDFWLRHGIDNKHGGWYTNLDKNGTAVGPFDKNSKVQADNLYWLSMLAGSKVPVIAESSLKDAADDTYSFLVSNMRRPDGLFVWMTNQQGEQISQPGSHIFSQWMVIAALARYGLAFQNKTAVEMALQTFKAVDNKFYNSSWGGYDVGKSDYLPFKALPGTNNVAPIPFNAFMQGVVAMGELYRAVQDPTVQQRLLEAVDRLCNRMPFPVTTAITNTTKHSTARGTVLSNSLTSKAEQTTTQEAAPGSSSPSSSSSSTTTTTPLRFAMNYDLRWSPAVVGDTSTSNGLNDSAVDYAHVLGHIWRALDVLQLLSAEGALPAADRNACQQRLAEIGAWSLDNAYDRQNNTGGIMYSGYVGQPPAKTMKVGWAQTESLMTMFYVWQIIGDQRYLQMLEGNLRFIYHSMLRNPASGELFYQVDRDGKLMEGDVRAGLPMAQIWKDAFHTIRPYVRLHTALQGSLGYIPGQV